MHLSGELPAATPESPESYHHVSCRSGEKGRGDAGEFNIDIEDLLQEVEKYRLRCFWLKIPMCLVSGGDWFFSLERKDPFKVRIPRLIRF